MVRAHNLPRYSSFREVSHRRSALPVGFYCRAEYVLTLKTLRRAFVRILVAFSCVPSLRNYSVFGSHAAMSTRDSSSSSRYRYLHEQYERQCALVLRRLA